MLRKEYTENPFNKEEYGRLLKLALGPRNQKQFCVDAGLSRSYINKYINGMMDKPPTIGKKLQMRQKMYPLKNFLQRPGMIRGSMSGKKP